MAAGVRFTKVEREFIRGWVQATVDSGAAGSRDRKTADSILEKLEKSEMVKGKGRAPGIPYPKVLEAFRCELGDRLVPPLGGAVGMMLKRIGTLGLTLDDLHTIAREAGRRWKGRIKAESLVRQAETLLHESRLDTPLTGAPVGMEDI